MNRLGIYLVSRPTPGGYDTFAGFVAVAEDEEAARCMYPVKPGHADMEHRLDTDRRIWQYTYDVWCEPSEQEWYDCTVERPGPWVVSPDDAIVKRIGDAAPGEKPGIVLSSYHAG